MRTIFTAATAALLCTTALGHAGGVERSVFNPGFLFEKGNYIELSFGSVSPKVSGSALTLAGVKASGDMADSFTLMSGALKQDMSDSFSLGLVVDQPIGANVTYPTGTGYPFAGSSAEVAGTQVSVIGLYRLSPNVSAYGGLRVEKATGEAVVTADVSPYTLNKVSSTGYGYVLGAAYERPEIALRVALSYISSLDHNFSGSDTYGAVDFTTTVPQAWKLDFQTGVAANTLVFGSVEWRDWSEFDIVTRRSPDPFAADLRTGLSTDNKDTVTYTLGVGRKFTDALSGAVSLGYEPANGGTVGNLAATDGYKSLTLAGIYTLPQGAKITVGATYGLINDATTSGINGKFTDNEFAGIGVKVGWNF